MEVITKKYEELKKLFIKNAVTKEDANYQLKKEIKKHLPNADIIDDIFVFNCMLENIQCKEKDTFAKYFDIINVFTIKYIDFEQAIKYSIYQALHSTIEEYNYTHIPTAILLETNVAIQYNPFYSFFLKLFYNDAYVGKLSFKDIRDVENGEQVIDVTFNGKQSNNN